MRPSAIFFHSMARSRLSKSSGTLIPGKSKGFGFIEMANDDEADNAIQKLNGTDVLGRSIRVNVARPKKNED